MQLLPSRKFPALIVLTLSLCLPAFSACSKRGDGAGHGDFPTSVVAEPVKEEKIEDKISLVGTLAADESVEIKNQIDGVIENIGFEEGEPVTAGQMLLMIDAEKLNATAAQAEANLGLAQTTYDRLSSLINDGAISQQEYDQATSDLAAKKAELQLIKAQVKESVITAPFAGVMGERTVSLGQFVAQGTTLTYLVRQDPIKAEFSVPERFLGQLRTGQTIEVSVAAYPQQTFKGKIYFIDPLIDEQTRTALVKAKLPNPDAQLRQGMFANLDLIIAVRSEALTVPETALIPRAETVSVFVVDSDSKAELRPVKVGVRLAGKAEITEGVTKGEMVVVEGYQKIGPGSLVAVAGTDSADTAPGTSDEPADAAEDDTLGGSGNKPASP